MSETHATETIGRLPLEAGFSERLSTRLAVGASTDWWTPFATPTDFIADELRCLARDKDSPWPFNSAEGAASALAFITNELVENAVKFNQAGSVDAEIGVAGEAVFCVVANQITNDSIPALRVKLNELLEGDPGERLRRRAEANVDAGGSGLGYLTIMNDYGAALSWRIERSSADLARIQTMACVPTKKG